MPIMEMLFSCDYDFRKTLYLKINPKKIDKMRTFMKPALLSILLFLLFYCSAFSQPIQLNPDSTGKFVMDPSTFSESDNSNAVWQRAPFGKKEQTIYRPDRNEKGDAIIIAESNNSISSVKVEVQADVQEFSILEWSWKIDSILESGDVTKKDGDDYAAKIYITFDYPVSELSFGDKIKYRFYKTFTRFDVPTRALNYIWANKAKVGSIHSNPYTDWVKMIAVESGNEKAGTWQTEQRNILKDYMQAFGEEPPAITGIQIMTDSDNTGETAKAYYGKIILRKKTAETGMND